MSYLEQSNSEEHKVGWWLPGTGASQAAPVVKNPPCQYRRRRLDPWVGKIPWKRKWQPTPVFLPGASPGQRSLAGYSPWAHKEPDTTE